MAIVNGELVADRVQVISSASRMVLALPLSVFLPIVKVPETVMPPLPPV